MAASPYAYQTARQTTGYEAAPKKRSGSIYAAPQAAVSSPYSPFVSTTGYQPAAPEVAQAQVTPAAPAAAPSAAHIAATTVTPPQSFDFHTDPILQQINAIGTQSRSGADAAALATKKQIATTYGDADYARNVLGDTATADAAAANPYAQYAMLAKQNTTNAGNLDESLNDRNLFFSGARINQQGDLANQYGKAVAGTAANEQSALGATENARLAAYTAADAADAQAAQDAQARALSEALLNQPPPTFDISKLLGGGSTDPPLPDIPGLAKPVYGSDGTLTGQTLGHVNAPAPASGQSARVVPQKQPLYGGTFTLTDLARALGYGSAGQRARQLA